MSEKERPVDAMAERLVDGKKRLDRIRKLIGPYVKPRKPRTYPTAGRWRETTNLLLDNDNDK